MKGKLKKDAPKRDDTKPYKVIQAPVALGLISAIFNPGMMPQIRLIGEYEKLEDAQEAAYMENADEPAPDKGDFRKFFIIEFHGWEKPWRVHN